MIASLLQCYIGDMFIFIHENIDEGLDFQKGLWIALMSPDESSDYNLRATMSQQNIKKASKKNGQ